MSLIYLEILKRDLNKTPNDDVVEINYKALRKFEEAYGNLKQAENKQILIKEYEDIQSFGGDTLRVNRKEMNKQIKEYEDILMK